MPAVTDEPGFFASRLDALFREVPRRDGKAWTASAVAKGLSRVWTEGKPPTHQYISQLRKGTRANPTLALVKRLADLFAVPVAYFTDTAVEDAIADLVTTSNATKATALRRLITIMAWLDPSDQEAVIGYAAARAALAIPPSADLSALLPTLPPDVALALASRLEPGRIPAQSVSSERHTTPGKKHTKK